MSVILPDWVAHVDQEKKKRQTIFSAHAHPDGTRIATGGLDSKICIWATGPLLDEKQDVEGADKLLSTLSRHSGSVLVVRWSHNGAYLASGSDDTIALIWELDPSGAGSFAFGSSETNIESYRCVRRLTGHESDVADLAWSPHDDMLATVGLDAHVCIYSGYSFERVRKIDGHQGFVKGVVWDSVGHFLATASDDKTVKIWRVDNWALEAEVRAPFANSPNSPFFRRPSWSPDGAHLLTANAMNGPVFVASVIMRGPWSSDVSLVGHENAVSVTAFNPRLFRGTDSPKSVATVLALGGIDQSVSVWVTGHPRPVLVFKDVFERQVTDLSWSADGLVLYASSADGSLAVFQFSHDQLPNFASDDELENARNVFGYRKPSQYANGPHGSLPRPPGSGGLPSTPARTQLPLLANGTPARLQQEITIKNGKRRIRPTLVGGADAGSSQQPQSAVGPYSAGLSSVQHALPPSAGVAGGSSSMSIASLTNGGLPGAEFSRGLKRKAEDEGYPVGGSLAVTRADGNRSVPRKPPVAHVGTREVGETLGGAVSRDVVPIGYAAPILSAHTIGTAVSGTGSRSGSAGKSGTLLSPRPVPAFYKVEQAGCMLDIRNFDGSGSRPAEVSRLELPVVNGQERILWLDFIPTAIVAATITPSFSAIVTADRSLIVYSASGRRLFNTTLSAHLHSIRSVGQYLMVITVTGELLRWVVEGGRASPMGNPVSLVSILSSDWAGSAQHPPLVDARIYTNGAPILITAAEKAYTLDNRSSSKAASNESKTSPETLVCISDAFWAERSSFWDASLRTRLGGVGGSADGPAALLWREPLRAIEAEINALVHARRGSKSTSGGRPPLGLPPTGAKSSGLEMSTALRHLETRMLGCEVLGSGAEYRASLLLYAQKLGEEGIRNMGEELVRSLMGPVYFRPGAQETWEPEVVGMSKRALLSEVLAIFSNGRLQALADQYADVLRAMSIPGL